ncbi:hypothetical protein M514_00726 [Trichuris suis]|uniref:Uncharacterized protein n=1 Tax=Trichuris suis TaxID=68888 RepID=A0A085N6N3_9BILA|nr:hypothetical protein M514_00726 [Trichuris suis]
MITGDETCFYQYEPDSKIQSKEWLLKRPAGSVKFKAERSVKKIVVSMFWDSDGVMLIDFLEGKKTSRGASRWQFCKS